MNQLVEAALEEAPQALFGEAAAEASVEQLPSLIAALQGPAVRLALEMRLEQIVRHGHDAEADAMLPLDHLPRQARDRLVAAIEQISATAEKRNLPVAMKNLARTAALCLAAIDRIRPIVEREQAGG
jgi:sugar phosphate isomerase/epimerase